MQTELKLPELGENIETADVVNVLVKEGDYIKKDQSVIEIETDKATIEVPSTVEGKITKLFVKAGDKVKVGSTIIIVEATEAQPTEIKKPEVAEAKEEKVSEDSKPQATEPARKTVSVGKKEIVEFHLPDLGENITTADVVNVLVKPGDYIEKDQGIIEIETDKATIEVPSSISGKVVEVLVKTGDKAKVGQTIVKIESGEMEEKSVTEVTESQKPETTPSPKQEEKRTEPLKQEAKGELPKLQAMEVDEQPPILKGAAPAAPSVRRLAREIGVDINKVPGTGPGGRITMDDVKAYSKKFHESRTEGSFISGIKSEALPDFSKFGDIKKVEMSNIRKKTAEHLSYAWATIPHVTQFDKADITNLEKARKELSKNLEKSGAKLTVTAILVNVIVEALKKYPQFNSSIDMEKKEIIYKNYYNIGIAVDTEHGLIVPVIKDADKKSLTQISIEMNSLAEKARAKKIGLDDLQGGCFTITNLGGIGGTHFTPIVNLPEVAILGVSRSSYEPVWNGYGVFEPRLMLPLSLSYDHRIIDGADAIRFLRFVVEALEQPLKLLL
ncbi:dihydrolipoyllysine-residue acetyltransferase [Ignavibacterium sp.]|uniref:dihydrolipoyllysine-residue acetyltransferase n=1 Tax=Ignavibacterium sp. TaxID=2651167 RepID=UPI00307E0BDD